MHVFVVIVLAFVFVAVDVPKAADVDKQTAKQVEARIEEFFTVDGRTQQGHAERAKLLLEIDELAPDPLTAKEAESWRKLIFKQWEKGRRLPKKTGREYFWKDEKRGLYIIGGVTKKPKGLLIGMHGGGVGSGDCGEAAGFLSNAAKKRKWVAIFPEVLEKTEHGWTTSGTEEWVMELVDRARRTYGVDADRVYFAGHSMGGYGSWTLGAHHADRVAALGPAAGAPTPYTNREGVIWDIEAGVVPNLRNVPMRIFQSLDDPQVPAEANQIAVKKVGEAKQKWGGYEDFEYIEVDGHGHSYPPGGGKPWLEALSKFKRDPHPQKIVWQPWLSWKRQFYWLYWDVPEQSAVIVAEVVDKHRIRIESEARLDGLWVLLQPDLVDIDKEVTIEVNGKDVFRGIPERKLSTLLLTGVFGDEGLCTAVRVPAFGT